MKHLKKKQWDFLNVQNKSVLDIGAFVGDSPIYFILKGAKKVYAIEPHPKAYVEMLENTVLNKIISKIIPIEMGINYEKDYVYIPKEEINIEGSLFRAGVPLDRSVPFNPKSKGIKVPAGKLSDIIDKYNIDVQILKMDCEGCEYDAILKDYDTIKEFDEIGFEYHAYNTKIPVSKLLEKLNKDFECKIIRNWVDKEYPKGKLGIIHCIRKR